MARTAAISRWAITGARSVLPDRAVRERCAPCGARTVRTRRGLALFDDMGRFVGRVDGPAGAPAFGPGGRTLLLRRWP
jgi:hypothetical protein